MRFPLQRFFLLLIAVALTACVAVQPTEIIVAFTSPTPSQTPSPTETIIWFPATATPTPLATSIPVEPTPEMHPNIGTLLLEDSFSDEVSWHTERNINGSVAYGVGELSLAISKAEGQLMSLRNGPVLDDFYLEITASPSLCRQQDAYGLILRASGEQVYYRFVITCGAQVRLERVSGGHYTVLQDWLSSGQVPLGSPISIRLGVWALGNEMRFFVNDVYQFGYVNVPELSGQIGVFARSGGESALTVSFSDLKVFSLSGNSVGLNLSVPESTPNTSYFGSG
jgi:hypothetical protein